MDTGLLILILFFFVLFLLLHSAHKRARERARRRTVEKHVATLGGRLVGISNANRPMVDEYEHRYAYKYVDQSGRSHEGLRVFDGILGGITFYEDEAMADAD